MWRAGWSFPAPKQSSLRVENEAIRGTWEQCRGRLLLEMRPENMPRSASRFRVWLARRELNRAKPDQEFTMRFYVETYFIERVGS